MYLGDKRLGCRAGQMAESVKSLPCPELGFPANFSHINSKVQKMSIIPALKRRRQVDLCSPLACQPHPSVGDPVSK